MSPKERTARGGTIVVDIDTLEEHDLLLASPGGYRPATCSWCGHDVLHVHDYRHRKLKDFEGVVHVVKLARFACNACGAVWRLMPKFICAGLRSTWETVERVVVGPERERSAIPRRTQQRWRARLASSSRALVMVLASSLATWAVRVACATGHHATRADLVAAFSDETGFTGHAAFANLAEVLERIYPSTRLMSLTGFVRSPSQRPPTPPEMATVRFPQETRVSTECITERSGVPPFPPLGGAREREPERRSGGA